MLRCDYNRYSLCRSLRFMFALGFRIVVQVLAALRCQEELWSELASPSPTQRQSSHDCVVQQPCFRSTLTHVFNNCCCVLMSFRLDIAQAN